LGACVAHCGHASGSGEKEPPVDVVTPNQIRPPPTASTHGRNALKFAPTILPLSVLRPIPGLASGYWTLVTIRILALLPFLGVLVGACFFNRVTPLVFGLPLLLAWLLLWLLLTSAIMALIYWLDPANRPSVADDGQRP
jgi:hypothetical protein